MSRQKENGVFVRKGFGRLAALAGGIAVASAALSPAFSAVTGAFGHASAMPDTQVSLKMLGSIGSFTPVTRDERLARAYARAARESQSRGFRFTPTAGSTSGERSLNVLVRAPADPTAGKRGPLASTGSNLGIARVDYSLGKENRLERLAGESAIDTNEPPIVGKLQLPTSGFLLQPKRNRFSTNLQVEARNQTGAPPVGNAPQTLGGEKSYALDLSSSFALTRNLNVQAGLRYRGPDNRLVPLDDQKQDSQAVYVGTTVKF